VLFALISLIKDWAPWVLLASFPSVLNLVIAVQDLQRESKRLPFFNPCACWGFWIFCLVQLLLPAIAFWLFFSIDKKPSIDLVLYIKAGLFGVGFNAFVNNSVQVGPIGFNVKAFYDVFIGIAIEMILAKEASRTAIFWATLTSEFSNSDTKFEPALDFLTQYVKTSAALDSSLKSDARTSIMQQHEELIKTAKRKKLAPQKADAIVNAIKQIIRRCDLPHALHEFGCTQTLDKCFKKKP
jgi:hypothetical protein